MLHLSPPTLTHSEQRAILRATASNPRDHQIYSLALDPRRIGSTNSWLVRTMALGVQVIASTNLT